MAQLNGHHIPLGPEYSLRERVRDLVKFNPSITAEEASELLQVPLEKVAPSRRAVKQECWYWAKEIYDL